MTTITRLRSSKGSCTVEKADVLEEIVCESRSAQKYMPTSRGGKRPTALSVNRYRDSTQTSDMNTKALLQQSMDMQNWLNEKQVKVLQEKSDHDARVTRQMYENVLTTENSFVKDMADFLAKKEMLHYRKKELLHKKWTENVGEPIRKEILKEMNGPNYHELVRRKKELYKEYLEHVNRKGHVFLDVISPEEYYPMALHPVRPSMLKAETPKLNDPLLQQERERYDENRVLFRCETGATLSDRDLKAISLPPVPLVPLGRHGTEARTWIKMPMSDIESPPRIISRRRMNPNFNSSNVGPNMWAAVPSPPAKPKNVDETATAPVLTAPVMANNVQSDGPAAVEQQT